jgi:bacteriorhodopsin
MTSINASPGPPNPINVMDKLNAPKPPPGETPPPQNTIVDIEKKPKTPENPVQYYVKFSFTMTYILLLTTATITIIEALRTKTPVVRHVLNLETCISIVAGYFYSIFVAQIDKYSFEKKEIDWSEITKTRYIDWSLTTPLMLLVLCVVLGNESGQPVRIPVILMIIALNYGMLFLGYLGETSVITRWISMISGFVLFFVMFAIIFTQFVLPKRSMANYILFGVYLSIWSLYGVVFMFSESYKNIAMNILDLTSKCIVGLGLWAYYTKIVKF